MAEFHFLRPAWLLALPIGVLLILLLFRARADGSGWRSVVDRSLQPFVLTAPAALAGRPWPLFAALAAWVLATLALAGPAWERLPVPAFRSNEALVVALDLSRSMDAADLKPSRLSRAKLKLLSLLEQRTAGQVGLVVFSAHAFTVTPLTTDTRTIASLVAALSTDIMPSSGSYVEAGLDKAAALLRQAGVTQGDILLISDAQPSPAALERARDLRRDGFAVHVLGVGTEEGAPIPEPDGGFYTDNAGRVVVPRVDVRSLGRLADAGGGRFSMLTADDRDLDLLVAEQAAGALSEGEEDDSVGYEADVWRDGGLWVAVLLLPLLAFGFRRGWVAVWVCALLVLPPPVHAQGDDVDSGFALSDLWQSLWQRPDQRGADALAADRPERAARLFEDPEWRAAAEYRAGDYADSAADLAALDTVDAHYNRGNALARAGELRSAIGAYDRALELHPEHDDARYNRELVQQLLEEQESEQQNPQSGEQEQQQSAGDESREGESQEGESGGESSEQQAQSPESGQDQEPGGDSGEGETEEQAADADEDRQDPADGDGESTEDGQQPQSAEAAPGDEEVEQWASEQAADQWLRRIPQDPGGLLRRKFLYQYQRLGIDQDGNYVWPGDEAEPW